MLRVELLGRFQLRIDEQLRTLSSHRLQSLLAYLVLNAGNSLSRQHIAFLFWPDSSEEHAFACLRKNLHELKQRLPDCDPFLRADRHSITWLVSPAWTCDVHEFEALTRAEIAGADDLRRSLSLYAGELLPGCYDDWIQPRRDALQRQFRDILSRGIQVLEGQRCYSEAIAIAQRLLELDRLNEESYRTLMRLFSLYGDRATALKLYHDCARVLRRELAVVPSSETKTIYQSLLRAEGSARIIVSESRPPLVGRQEEWRMLRECLERTEREGPATLLLRGAPGIGKTRLAEALADHATCLGWTALSSRCMELEDPLPLSTLASIVRLLPLDRLEPSWRRELLPLLPEQSESRKEDALREPDVRRQRLYEAAAKALATVQPCLLTLNDIQWCDSASLDWLIFLLRTYPHLKVLLLLTGRQDELTRASGLVRSLARLRQAGAFEALDILPLTPEDTRALATSLLDPADTQANLEGLQHESQGNPLYLIELIRLGYGHDRSEIGVSIPPTFQAIWEARLARLDHDTFHLVGFLAVLSRPCTVQQLLTLLEMETSVLLPRLTLLTECGLLAWLEDGSCGFSHPRLSDFTRESLGPALRPVLHLKAARGLEQLLIQSGRLELHQEIAEHLLRAHDLAGAGLHRLKAAKAALRMGARQDALRIADSVLNLAVADARGMHLHFEALLLSERILDGMGDRSRQEGILSRLLHVAQEAQAPAGWYPQVLLLFVRRAIRLGSMNDVQGMLDEADRVAAALGLAGLQADLLLARAQELYQRAPREPEVQGLLERALKTVEGHGNTALYDEISSMLLYVRATSGLLQPSGMPSGTSSGTSSGTPSGTPSGTSSGTSSGTLARAPVQSIRVKHSAPPSTSVEALERRLGVHRDQARMALALGDACTSAEQAREALVLAQQLKDPFQIAQHASWIGFSLYLLRQFSEAHRFFGISLEAARQSESQRRALSCLLWACELHLELGRIDAAGALLEEATQQCQVLNDALMWSYTLASSSRLELVRARAEQGEALALEGLRVLREGVGETSGSFGVLHRWLGHALLAQGRWDEAWVSLQACVDTSVGIDRYFHAQDAQASLAGLHALEGRLELALTTLDPLMVRLGGPVVAYVAPQKPLLIQAQVLALLDREREADDAVLRARWLLDDTLKGLDATDAAWYKSLPQSQTLLTQETRTVLDFRTLLGATALR